jgi:hypothetical protein
MSKSPGTGPGFPNAENPRVDARTIQVPPDSQEVHLWEVIALALVARYGRFAARAR